MYESAYQVGRHLTRHSGRDNTLSDNTIFIAVELFSADRKVTTTSVNDHAFSTCENKLKARNRIRLLNLVCLFLYRIKRYTSITDIIRIIELFYLRLTIYAIRFSRVWLSDERYVECFVTKRIPKINQTAASSANYEILSDGWTWNFIMAMENSSRHDPEPTYISRQFHSNDTG